MLMDYIEESSKIIMQAWHTRDDIKKLSQYRFQLAVEYKETNTRWSAQEWQYNWYRSSQSSKKINEWMAVTRAEAEAKNEAEVEHWHYRVTNADAQWIKQIIDAISWFVISTQGQIKSLEETQF